MENPISSWRNIPARYRLQGVQCSSCNTYFYPNNYYCSCGSKNFKPYQFSGIGSVKSFSCVRVAPVEYLGNEPYVVAYIQLQEGPYLIAQLSDVSIEEVFLGMLVTMVFRRYYAQGDKGIIYYGIKFVPLS